MTDVDHESAPPPPIQAYYKLTFPNFEYYLQTLSVTIGRRPIDKPTKSSVSRHSYHLDEPAAADADPIVVKPEDEDGLGMSDSAHSLVKGEEVAIESLQSLA